MSAALTLVGGGGSVELDVARGAAPTPTLATLERKRRFESRYAGLKAEYEERGWRTHHMELQQWIQPRRGRFNVEETNRGGKLDTQIHDGTAKYALRDLAGGMMSGNTSQARPWFRLGSQDPALNEYGPVRQWLHVVQQRMEYVFQQSNWYGTLPGIYESSGLFGTAAGCIFGHPDRVIHCDEYEVGSFYLGTNEYGDVDTCYRLVRMSARQIARKFGEGVLSRNVRQALRNNTPHQLFDVIHAIEPNDVANPKSALSRNKPIASVWWEASAGDEVGFLRESGFERFPVVAPRWWRTGSDVYGRSPAMDVLGDVKQLHTENRQKLEGLEILVKPPMVSRGIHHVKLVPGGVSQTTDLEHGLRAAYQISLPLGELREDIRDLQEKIRTGMFSDLFRMISQLDGKFTAYEIAARQEEKLMLIGPVLDSVHNDLLGPGIDLTFDEMLLRGMIPPPPPELEGQQLKVEYISILAQAQRAIGTGSLDRLLSQVLTMAPVMPTVLDKFDADAYLEEYAQKLGTAPQVVRSDDEVEGLRADRAQREQMAAAVASAKPVASAMKDLSQSEVEPGNALGIALNRLGAAPQ